MSVPSEARGFFQGDLIIRSAIIAALDDMRASPWLLDYAFAGLAKDRLTAPEYGHREIEAAKRWFLNTKIPVFMSTRIDDAELPCISITQAESSEAEVTLADVHYVPEQPSTKSWPPLTAPFTPERFDPRSGEIVLPQEVTLVLAPGQRIVDRQGNSHEFLEVLGDRRVLIRPGVVADFRDAVIKGREPTEIVAFEAVQNRETYAIGCHVQGEQVHLTYLHTLLLFALYRYKKTLFEARGFERSTISSSDFRRNDSFENELTFSRHIMLSGFVIQVWPADITPRISSVSTEILASSGVDSEPIPIGDEDPMGFWPRR